MILIKNLWFCVYIKNLNSLFIYRLILIQAIAQAISSCWRIPFPGLKEEPLLDPLQDSMAGFFRPPLAIKTSSSCWRIPFPGLKEEPLLDPLQDSMAGFFRPPLAEA